MQMCAGIQKNGMKQGEMGGGEEVVVVVRGVYLPGKRLTELLLGVVGGGVVQGLRRCICSVVIVIYIHETMAGWGCTWLLHITCQGMVVARLFSLTSRLNGMF
jgi:hypothetical protein